MTEVVAKVVWRLFKYRYNTAGSNYMPIFTFTYDENYIIRT